MAGIRNDAPRSERAEPKYDTSSTAATADAVLLVGYLQQGLQMAGVPNQVSSALSGALLIVVVVGRSVSLHRQQIKEWLARRANNPLP